MQQISPGSAPLPWVPAVFCTDEVSRSAAKPPLASGLHAVKDGRISGFPKHVSSLQVWAPIGDCGAGGTCCPESWCRQHPWEHPLSLQPPPSSAALTAQLTFAQKFRKFIANLPLAVGLLTTVSKELQWSKESRIIQKSVTRNNASAWEDREMGSKRVAEIMIISR